MADQWSESASLFARETLTIEICNLDLLERQLWKNSVSHVISFLYNLTKGSLTPEKNPNLQVVVETHASLCPNNFTSPLYNSGALQLFPHIFKTW